MPDSTEQNPFKAAMEGPPSEGPGGGGSQIAPFRADAEAVSGPGALLRRKVRDMGLGDPKNPKVSDLTVKDLNDLATEFQGVRSRNAKVASLTIADMEDLEGVFMEYKVNTARDLQTQASASGAVSAEWSVSCCCCTPCCSCAAAEMDPVHP
jgi:hypothetical protein